MDKVDIKEVIVVEGRDDTNAINRAVGAVTIETHGFGISKETWERLEAAYKKEGLIIFTDPDHAGNEIRRRIKEKYPDAKEAFLTKSKAEKSGDIGIENASPNDIQEALKKARATVREKGEEEYSLKDLEKAGLIGLNESRELREKLGDLLGIGYANGKTLLKRLNGMEIKREEFEKALKSIKENKKN